MRDEGGHNGSASAERPQASGLRKLGIGASAEAERVTALFQMLLDDARFGPTGSPGRTRSS
jgi:hypothetical protein